MSNNLCIRQIMHIIMYYNAFGINMHIINYASFWFLIILKLNTEYLMYQKNPINKTFVKDTSYQYQEVVQNCTIETFCS